jgi:osmotically inducible protein OsmC
MATFSRTVTVDWSGPIMEGKGVAKAGTGAFTLPVTFPSRIGEPAGTTSPEELMAASHASCYAMALNATLGRKQARHLAHAHYGDRDRITSQAGIGAASIRLMTAELTSMDKSQFADVAREAEGSARSRTRFAGTCRLMWKRM